MLTCCYNDVSYHLYDVLYTIVKSMHSKLVGNILLLALTNIVSYNCDQIDDHTNAKSLGRKYEARKDENTQLFKTKQSTKRTKNKFRSTNRLHRSASLG